MYFRVTKVVPISATQLYEDFLTNSYEFFIFLENSYDVFGIVKELLV